MKLQHGEITQQILPGDVLNGGFAVAALAQSVQLLGIDVSDGTVTINFSGDFTKIAEQSDGGIQAMRALMMTCTRYPGIKKVKILVDGKPYQLPVTDVPTFANVASEVESSYPEVMMIE